MLYINEGDIVPLPKKYHAINNLCAHLYDQLTEILTDEHYEELTYTSIDLDDKSAKTKADFVNKTKHAFDALNDNGLNEELTLVLTKHITMSLLSDFVNFVYESLSCARKGKMSVAYALLRKPFTDELLLFEQILLDKSEFINRFYHDGTPKTYDPGLRGIDKLKIITETTDKLKAKLILNSKLAYALRYDKACQVGINGISNRALHIVTSDPNYATPKQDLNFAFQSIKDHEGHWEHYYNFVPYLLLHSIAVIDEVIFDLLPAEELHANVKAIRCFKRIIAQLLYSQYATSLFDQSKNEQFILDNCFEYDCEACGHSNILQKHDFFVFFEEEDFYCSKCYESLLTSEDSIKPIIDLINAIE